MSTQGNASSARRVTRASSRGVGSREGSEDSSVNGEVPATPARSTRARTRGTPSKETSRDVGNRGSTAYGAKGKAFSGSSFSAEQANLAPADLLQQEVEKAQANQIRATRQASQLPPLVEEPDTDSGASSARGSRSTSASQSNEHTNRRAQGPNNEYRAIRTNADTTIDGNNIVPTIVEDSSVLERTFITTLRDRFDLWLNLGGAHEGDRINPIRRAGVARGMRGHDEDYDEAEFDMVHPQNVSRISQVALSLLLMIFIVLLDLYRGPLLGPKYDFLKNRSYAAPIQSGTHAGSQIHGRLSALERLADHLTSRARPDHDLVHGFQQINWFSPGLGAQVVPRLTSPSHIASCKQVSLDKLSWKDQFVARFLGSEGKCQINVPGVALRPWFDVDDRFCAPPSKGKLQLTVITNREIAPTELVIEYPKDAVPEKGNVPREIELWAEIHNTYTQQNVDMAYDGAHILQESQVNRELHMESALPDTFLLVGRWKYDLHSRNQIQTFRIPIDLKALGVKSNRLAVRVNTNWGDATATCLYRIRLHGHDMSEQKELLMDPLPSLR